MQQSIIKSMHDLSMEVDIILGGYMAVLKFLDIGISKPMKGSM